MPTDLEIARAAEPRPIEDVAAQMGVPIADVRHWGRDVAKVSLSAVEAMGPPRAR